MTNRRRRAALRVVSALAVLSVILAADAAAQAEPPSEPPPGLAATAIDYSNVEYPWPVSYLDVTVYGAPYRMAYMDVAPVGEANGRTVVLFHGTCTINSLSHLFGTSPYKTGDTSRNNFLLALITLGEGWHNNHHYYQGSTRQGFRWWQIDVSYYVLVMLKWCRLVWDLNPVPEKVLAEGRGTTPAAPSAK